MAQTRRKRRTKHRGTPAGTIEARGRTGRPLTAEERKKQDRASARERRLISKIDAALSRIDQGTYGYCEETDEPIGIRRLEARPIATLSIDAQKRHERMERKHRDD